MPKFFENDPITAAKDKNNKQDTITKRSITISFGRQVTSPFLQCFFIWDIKYKLQKYPIMQKEAAQWNDQKIPLHCI